MKRWILISAVLFMSKHVLYSQALQDTLLKNLEQEIIDTVFIGDLNNDDVLDTAFVYTPPMYSVLDEQGEFMYYFDCLDSDCYNKISFSCKLPTITKEYSICGSIENLGDLDQDGFDELIFSPYWFIGCWGDLLIYSYKKELDQWIIISTVKYHRCGDETLKSHLIQIRKKYYLKGMKLKDGDAEEYVQKIKF